MMDSLKHFIIGKLEETAKDSTLNMLSSLHGGNDYYYLMQGLRIVRRISLDWDHSFVIIKLIINPGDASTEEWRIEYNKLHIDFPKVLAAIKELPAKEVLEI